MKSVKRILWLPILLLMVALGFGNAIAQNTDANSQKESAEAWQYHKIVDVDVVQQYAKVPQPEGVMIIDARPYKPKYIKGHIPTAVNIPDSKFDKMVDKLPQDKETLLIFYCGGFT